MGDAARVTGVMICGAGHSGSTLLGMILGGAEGAFYAGEGGKIRYLHDSRKPLRKRVCKICGEDCPVWSGFHWDRGRPLYPQIAAHIGLSIVVDSTKDSEWISARAEELRGAGGRPCLILLLRDGRAVVNSRVRKYPDCDTEQQIRDWMTQMARSQALYDAFDGPKAIVRYEDLATGAEGVARRVCALVGAPFDAAMLDFQSRAHHPLGGNSGAQYVAARPTLPDDAEPFVGLNERTRAYYESHPGEIRLDLRWRDELSEENAALFQRLAGDFNRSMEWGE